MIQMRTDHGMWSVQRWNANTSWGGTAGQFFRAPKETVCLLFVVSSCCPVACFAALVGWWLV